MLRIETKGSPFERGKQQGQACKQIATDWFENASKTITERLGADSVSLAVEKAAPKIRQWTEWWLASDANALEECRGIAAGLGIEEELYFTICLSHRLLVKLPKCTVLGFNDEQGNTVIGKTDDIPEHELGINIMQIVRPDKGYNHISFGFAGSIGRYAGINEHGFAAGFVGVPGPSVDTEGTHAYVASPGIFYNCATVEEGIEYLKQLKVNHYGFGVLLADANGGIALVEKTAAGTIVLPPQADNWYTHTNHLLDEEFAGKNPRQREPVLSNGVRRFENSLKLAGSLPRSEDGMRLFLANTNDNGAICQSGRDNMWSDYRIMFIPARRELVCWPGFGPEVKEFNLKLSEIFSNK